MPTETYKQCSRWRGLCLAALFGLLAAAEGAVAALNDIVPSDFYPLQTGESTLNFYAYDRKSVGPYVDGRKRFDGEIDTRIAVVRASHFLEGVAGLPLSLVAVVPWASADVTPRPLAAALGRRAEGMADIRLGVTQWLVSDRENGEYLAVNLTLLPPTGEYERRQVLTIGENRNRMALSLGWVRNLGSDFVIDVIPEVAWYGDNRHFMGSNRLEQKSTRALTGYLRYRAGTNWQFHLGAQWNDGGETRINRIDQHNETDNTRLSLGVTYLTDDRKDQLIARVARDTEIRNGFRTASELLLRYGRRF